MVTGDTLNYHIGIDSNLYQNASAGSVISYFLPFLLVIAGLILFAMLLLGGFTLLTGAANKESQEKGRKMVLNSLMGFAILFAAFWIAQILQVIFKISIVS